MSGFPVDIDVLDPRMTQFLAKPFDTQRLPDAIGELLCAKRTTKLKT
jgi:hypothetical protein